MNWTVSCQLLNDNDCTVTLSLRLSGQSKLLSRLTSVYYQITVNSQSVEL